MFWNFQERDILFITFCHVTFYAIDVHYGAFLHACFLDTVQILKDTAWSKGVSYRELQKLF